MAGRTKNLSVCGLSVPFDGKPRFGEVGAYDTALKEGGEVVTLIRHMAPVIVNTRLRPAAPFLIEDQTVIDEDTALATLEVVRNIVQVLRSPKVIAALAEITAMMTPSR